MKCCIGHTWRWHIVERCIGYLGEQVYQKHEFAYFSFNGNINFKKKVQPIIEGKLGRLTWRLEKVEYFGSFCEVFFDDDNIPHCLFERRCPTVITEVIL